VVQDQKKSVFVCCIAFQIVIELFVSSHFLCFFGLFVCLRRCGCSVYIPTEAFVC